MVLTEEKREKAYQKWEKLEEQRGEELYDYIENNPFKSTNELSDALNIPRSSLKILLTKFVEGGLLVEEKKAIKNRLTKLYRIKKFSEFDFDDKLDDLIINYQKIEQVFTSHGIDQVNREVLETLNLLISNLCVKIVQNLSLIYQSQNAGVAFTKEDLEKYFNESISLKIE